MEGSGGFFCENLIQLRHKAFYTVAIQEPWMVATDMQHNMIRCLFTTRAEHKYKYRIETSKTNEKPTVLDRRDESVQIQVYKKFKT